MPPTMTIMDIRQKWKVQLDELDLVTMKSYLDVPRETSKFIWDVNRDSNEYYEVEIHPEHSREDNYELTKCYICDIDIPIAFKNRHEKSNRHAMNLKIINIALKRMVSHNENPSQNQQTNSINFCDICSNVVKNTENHESSNEHQQLLKHDLFLKYFLSLYEGKNNINDIITDINSNFVKGVKNDERSANSLEIYFKKIYIPKSDIKVLNDKTIRIQVDNSTLDCDINNFHGVNHIRGVTQCNVCRVAIDDLNEHINTDIHVTRISADLVTCCMRKIDKLYHHCILCNEIIYDVQDHLLEDEHKALLKEKYTDNTEISYINREQQCNERKNITKLDSKSEDNIDDKLTINNKHGAKLPDYDENEKEKVIIKKYDSLFCKICEVHIIGDDTVVDVHLNSEKHKLKRAVTEFDNKIESLANNVKVSEGITRKFYDDFFENRFNTPFCNLCHTYENDICVHKKKKHHIAKYKTFLMKYNIMADKEGHYCKTCKVSVQPNLSNHVLKYHDKELFDEKLTELTKTNMQLAFTDNINILWCKPCQIFIDNKKWFVIYHKKTEYHKDKLAEFYQKHSICKKLYDITKKNKNYCQACDVFLKLSKIMEHIDSLNHVNKIESISPKDSQALIEHNSKDNNILDSIEVTPSNESKTKGHKDNSTIDSTNSETNCIKKMELSKTALVNVDDSKTTASSSKHQTLSKACGDDKDDRNCADRKICLELTSDERKTDNISSASVSGTSALIGAWANPLNITDSKIKKKNFNPISVTEIFNVSVDNYCRVCRVTIPSSQQNAAEHIKGKRHINHSKMILSDNNIKIDNKTLFCGFCLVNIKDVIDHVSSHNHQRQMLKQNSFINPSASMKEIQESYWAKVNEAEYCFELTNDPKYVICGYCDIKIFSRDDLRKVHVLGAKHKQRKEEILKDHHIRKFYDKCHCALCLEEFEFGSAMNHMTTFKHVEQYTTQFQFTIDIEFFKLHKLLKSTFEDTFLCQICDEIFPENISELFDHVDSAKHDFLISLRHVINKNTVEKSILKHENAAETSQSNNNTKPKQQTKNKSPQNNTESACNNPLLYCDVCAKQFIDDTSYDNHETGKQHKEKFNNVMEVNSIKIKNNFICYCKLCDLYFNKISALKHIKASTHQGKLATT